VCCGFISISNRPLERYSEIPAEPFCESTSRPQNGQNKSGERNRLPRKYGRLVVVWYKQDMARSVSTVAPKTPTGTTNLSVESITRKHRSMVQEGVAAAERGEYTDYTEDQLKEFFAGVVQRGKKRLAAELKRSPPVK
jgi:hypothetical protein